MRSGILSVLFLFASLQVLAQFPISPNARDENNLRTGYWTILNDSADHVVTNPDSVVYYRIIRFEKGKPIGKVRDFFRTYGRQWEGYLTATEPDFKEGEAIYYFENGKVQYHGFFKNNRWEGLFQQYTNKGTLYAEGQMKNDTTVGQWTIYFPSGAKSTVYERVKGVDHGSYVDYYENGGLSEKGQKVNGEKSGFWIEYHPNGVVAKHANYLKGKLDGPYKFWNSAGILESEGDFKDDVKSGHWNEYLATGEKESDGNFINGEKSGWWKLYWPSGKLKAEGNRVNGLQQGPYVFYYENGKVSGKGLLVNSLYQDLWKFYNEDGTLKREVSYVRDTLHGPGAFYEPGYKSAEGNYIMGKKDGLWKYYGANGKLTGTEEKILDVSEGDDFNYHPSGQIKSKRKFVKGKRDGENLEYFPDGKLQVSGFYKDGMKEGPWKWYHANGQLNSSYSYVNDKYEGSWVNYFDNGKIESAGQGVNGRRNGWIKYYFANGLLKKEGNTAMGNDTGKWVVYDSLTGKKTSAGGYVDGKLDGRWKFYLLNGKLETISYYNKGFWETRGNISDSLDRLIEQGEYDLAWKEVDWLKRVIHRDVSKTSPAHSKPYYYYAVISMDRNQYEDSRMWYEKYMQSVKTLESDTCKNYEVGLNGLALCKMYLGQLDESIALYDRVIKMSLRSEGDYAIGIFNKAIALFKAKRGEEAEAVLRSEWGIARTEMGDTSRQAMNMLWVTGDYHVNWSDDDDKALEAYQKFYELLRKKAKHDDPRFVTSMRQIALSYKRLQKRSEAIQWYGTGISLEDSLHRNTSLPYLEDLRNLAGLYQDIDKQDTSLVILDIMLQTVIATHREGTIIHGRALEGIASAEYNKSNYPRAIELWKESIRIFEKQEDTGANYYTGSLQSLGAAINYSGPNNGAEAEPYYLKALQTTLTHRGENSVQYQRLLTNTGGFYRDERQYSKADSLLNLAEALITKYYGTDNAWYAEVQKEFGLLVLDQSNYEKSVAYFQKALVYWRPHRANAPHTCIDLLNKLGRAYRWWGKYEEAEKAIRESLSMYEKEIGGIDYDYLAARTQLAHILSDRQIYSEAEKMYLSILAQQAKLTGERHSDYGVKLEHLGYFYNETGDYKKAEKYYLLHEDVMLKAKGRLSYEYMNATSKLADVYSNMGLMLKADEAYKKALSLALKIYGDRSLEYARKARGYGKFCEIQGRKAEAARYFSIASNIAREVFGEDQLVYSFYLIDEARACLSIGRNAEAEALLQKTREITSLHMVDASDDYRESLQLLTSFYESMGRNEEAEKIHVEILSLIEASSGKHSFYAQSLIAAAGNDYVSDRMPVAKVKLEQALKILEEELVPGHYIILSAHNMLGLVALNEEKWDEAEGHFDYCVKQRILAKTDGSYDQAISLHNMGSVKMEKGQFAEAEKMHQQSAAVFKALGAAQDLDEQAAIQDNVAILYQAWGKYDLAEKNWIEVLQKYSIYIQRNFAFMSDYEKTKFWQKNKEDFENFNTFALLRKDQKPAILGTMYDNQLATKGILLSASNKVRKRIYESRDSAQINMYYDWVQNREQLAKEYAAATSDKKTAQVDSLERKVNALEKELSLSAEDLRVDKSVSWKEVQRTLAPDEAAIEIVRFHYFNRHKTDSVIYAALVLTADTKLHPLVAVLPKGEFLEKKAYKFYRNAIISQLEDTISYRQFWAAIAPLVKNKKKLFVSPDGVYNQVNLKTMKNSAGTYLMEQHDFMIVSNTRDLIAMKSRKKLRLMQTASLIGHPTFFVGRNEESKTGTTRGMNEEDRSGIADLPGTKKEIETVEQLLSGKGWKVNSLLETNATEKQVKELPSSRIVHVATHGFFQDETNSSWSTQDPMLRSGILLSGAANFMQNKQETNGENGILTAYEAANLSLEGTEMVVLSACETARGEIQQGEGVYGLQRAFISAGAESLIMSLWKVDDEATQKLMSLFYENWMKGMDKNEALNQAQRTLKKTYPHPYFWGAFVMMRG